jgi:hypothetical protein
MGGDFLNLSFPKTQETKAKINKWDYSKLNCSYTANETIYREKR